MPETQHTLHRWLFFAQTLTCSLLRISTILNSESTNNKNKAKNLVKMSDIRDVQTKCFECKVKTVVATTWEAPERCLRGCDKWAGL